MRNITNLGDPLKSVLKPLAVIVLLCIMVIMAGSCNGEAGESVGDNENDNVAPAVSGAPIVNIISPILNRNIAAGLTITITYNATNSPTDVIAFYDADGVFNGDELLIEDNLLDGSNRTVNFVTDNVVPGVYFFGIRATNSVSSTVAYAVDGLGSLVTITVDGRPQPAINAPSSNLEILFGTTASVAVVFNCNDPEEQVSWTVFFDTDQITDGSETTISSGTGNTDPGDAFNSTVDWRTLTVDEGTYSIGVTCADSAGSIETVYAAGRITITTELSIPTIEVTSPANDLIVLADEDIIIEFASSDPNATDAEIVVFLDTNNSLDMDDSEIVLGTLPASATSLTVNSSIIPDGTYFVGAFVERSGQRNVDYAPGKLTVSGVGDLTVSQPSETVTVKPGSSVTITWSTNVPIDRGLIDLALYFSDSSGIKGGGVEPDPLADMKDLPVSPSTVSLNTSTLTSSFYVVEITLRPTDANGVPTNDDPSTALSAPIRVTTLPIILWVGSIELDSDQVNDPPLGHFDGVVFEGINFEDNAGSSLMAIPTPTGFPLGGAFVIGAAFAKPLFTNPAGIGAGEAYLIYNDIGVINRRYSLNAVGSKRSINDDNPNALAGLRFTGIAFDQSPEDINGDGQINIYSEDVDGDMFLDFFNEDIDGDGVVVDEFGPTVEDIDLDGFADLAEDGFVGVDGNTPASTDGRINNPNQRFFFEQYVNGALDVNISEDRDGDGQLDAVGDATWGLSMMALLPDVDGDNVPELAFGFEFTDSLAADYRRDLFGETEPPNFGDLTQENQFERGGIVIVPSFDEATIRNPFIAGRGEDRVIQLDFVGQDFDPSPEDADDDDDDQDTTGVVPPNSMFQANRPLNGHDPYPFVRDRYGDSPNPAFCENDQISLRFVNNMSVDYPARATFTRFRIPNGGGDPQEDTVVLTATRGKFALVCMDVGDETVLLNPMFVELLDPDISNDPTPIADADTSGMSTFGPAAGGSVVYGVSGGYFSDPDDPDFIFLIAFARDSEFSFGGDTCAVGGTDGCFETMVGPFYGFDYDAVAFMDSPTHPLAYRRTLANPTWRAGEFALLNSACGDKCGRVLPDFTTILDGGAPSYGTISTGFYPGVARDPAGARILGQRAGDRFARSISRSPGSDNRVFVGAPLRPDGLNEDAGAVYQFKMESFWTSANDLAGLNDFDVPKPHQYIVKEIGSRRPDNLVGAQRASMANAIVYSGADAGDRLGGAVVGILDFNGDARPDILMGAPGADGNANTAPDSGAVYVLYRLPSDIEASVSLEKIELDPSNVNRLNGLLINGDLGDQMGSVLAGNCDLNGDNQDDIVLGNSLHGGNDAGEVVVIFGGTNLASPAGGFSIQELVDLGRAVRIQGTGSGDQAGFNVACEGDFDGDGQDDLVLSVPFATPLFDSDGDDILDTPGLDLDRDGFEDGTIADPTGAGLVYVITNMQSLSGTLNLSQMGAALQGFIFAGRQGGDNLGGGFDEKRQIPSRGLSYAGDVNGDGKTDLLVSSILADPKIGGGSPKMNAGEVYLIHGFNAQEAEDFLSGN